MKLNLHGGSLIWLRRDLRIMDNNLVQRAILENKKLVFCFIFDDVILGKLKLSPFGIRDNKSLHVDRRIGFIYSTLHQIKKELWQIGSDLLVSRGDPVNLIPKIAKKINAGCVLWSKDYEQYAMRRDKKIANALELLNIKSSKIKNQCFFEESEVLTNDGNPYTVFTPYKKKMVSYL